MTFDRCSSVRLSSSVSTRGGSKIFCDVSSDATKVGMDRFDRHQVNELLRFPRTSKVATPIHVVT